MLKRQMRMGSRVMLTDEQLKDYEKKLASKIRGLPDEVLVHLRYIHDDECDCEPCPLNAFESENYQKGIDYWKV